MKVLYRALLLATAVTAQMELPSDMPSDVPSSVPTTFSASPSSLPTIMTAMGEYDPCPVCPEGQVVGTPDKEIPTSGGQTCGGANQAGITGFIPPDQCALLQQAGPALCECAPMASVETAMPSASPVAMIVPPPSSGPCTVSTCTDVMSWGSLGAFVQAAASGDSLCMCGRFYTRGLCGAPIVLSEDKNIEIECVPGNVCSFSCPTSAFVVNAGSLTLTGTEENFSFSGGSMYSRIVVGEEGSLVATGVVFEK